MGAVFPEIWFVVPHCLISQKVTAGRKSAILPNWCFLLSIPVLSGYPCYVPNSLRPKFKSKYLECGYKGLVFCTNNGWIMENMDKEMTHSTVFQPKTTQMPQNIFAQFVCPSPKDLDSLGIHSLWFSWSKLFLWQRLVNTIWQWGAIGDYKH